MFEKRKQRSREALETRIDQVTRIAQAGPEIREAFKILLEVTSRESLRTETDQWYTIQEMTEQFLAHHKI